MTPAEDASAPAPSMEAYNRGVLAQIEDRIMQGLRASMRTAEYCVVRNATTGVCAVVASGTTGEDPHRVFGPAEFAECLHYINTTVVTRMAEQPERHRRHHASRRPQPDPPSPCNAPERNQE
ncbi:MULTISPECIES: hypothetical protein [Gammaproteobacteria]|uniref:Uncharacterized protein n=1 Tax=Xanthomonas boreopolis TaxID=86183 RepID=A0A919FA59_9XANT|nr:hypothetical protein [Pseudomonas sp. Hp2]GHH57399.1 hypothetical protein GCM10009090_28490 [[Pseudomonas] boreopolis]